MDAEARANSGARVVAVPGDNEVCCVGDRLYGPYGSSMASMSVDSDLKSSSETERAAGAGAGGWVGEVDMVQSDARLEVDVGGGCWPR